MLKFNRMRLMEIEILPILRYIHMYLHPYLWLVVYVHEASIKNHLILFHRSPPVTIRLKNALLPVETSSCSEFVDNE